MGYVQPDGDLNNSNLSRKSATHGSNRVASGSQKWVLRCAESLVADQDGVVLWAEGDVMVNAWNAPAVTQTHRFFTTVLVAYQERDLRRGKTSQRCRPM